MPNNGQKEELHKNVHQMKMSEMAESMYLSLNTLIPRIMEILTTNFIIL